MSELLDRNKRGYPWLLGALALIFVMHAFTPGPAIVQMAGTNLILLVVLVATVRSVASRKRAVVIGSGLALLAFVLSWVQFWVDAPAVSIAAYLCYIAFFVMTGLMILGDVFSHGDVDTPHIAGAICVYLLLGVIGGFLFSLIGILDPAAITFPEGTITESQRLNSYFYFSFVTLSTVGYGDIVPVSKVARSLATLLAVFGQVYLAVLIAGLVSRSIASRRDEG